MKSNWRVRTASLRRSTFAICALPWSRRGKVSRISAGTRHFRETGVFSQLTGTEVTRQRAVLGLEWVQPPELREAAEVLAGRCQQGSMFDGERGEYGVRYQWTSCSVITDEFFQNPGMKRSRMQRNDAGLPQPFANDCECFLGRFRIRPDSGVGADASECPNRHPRQADYAAAIEQVLKPLCRGLLPRRIGVIGRRGTH